MDDLTEKVAKAIFDPFGAYFSNGMDDEDWHNARDICRTQAHAAIEVVRAHDHSIEQIARKALRRS